MKTYSVLCALVLVLFTRTSVAADVLMSWSDGELKKSIVKFVKDVTQDGGPHFVKPEHRIATFDNDGTLWSEVPTVEVEFTKQRLQQVLKVDPSLKTQEPYASLLREGKAALAHISQKQILDVMAKTHAGMSEDVFAKEVQNFFQSAKHPKYQVPYTQTVYQPMLELLAFLRENDFKIFITSGGDVSFMRVVATEIYGIPSQNIIGSFFVDKVQEANGKLEVMRTDTLGMMNDGPNKPVGISRHIGRRPIFAVGNERSGGDIQHLRYSKEGTGPNFQIMVNHDDVNREAAYQEKDNASLGAAKKFGFRILSIKNDWKQVFPNRVSIAQEN